MGPYCKFCNNRCFVHFPQGTPEHILKAYGSSTIIATCPEGQRFEKEKVGYCYNDIIEATYPDPAYVDLMSAGYEWTCPNCSIHHTEIEWKSKVTCDNCKHEFTTNQPEHALGD